MAFSAEFLSNLLSKFYALLPTTPHYVHEKASYCSKVAFSYTFWLSSVQVNHAEIKNRSCNAES